VPPPAVRPAANSSPAVEVQLAFTRPEDVTLDDPRRGLRRARTLDAAAMNDPRSYDPRTCRVLDCSALADFRPDLREHGFAHADLSRLPALHAALARVRAAGRIDATDIRDIRRRLVGRSLPLSGGASMRLLYVAADGLFMRRAGPNGLRMPGVGAVHDAAREVHADQDVEGTPLRQILRGAAPWLFHHDSPDRRNVRSPIHLVNLWIPLEQATRPLALMDRRTLDRKAHQLRYGLPTDDFLRRREDMRINDIWTFLHDPRQQWYFTSSMPANTAYVFETLGTPHGSFILPGEARAEARHRQLVAAIDAVRRRDELAAIQSLAPSPDSHAEPVTEPLRRAIAAMDAALAEARADPQALCRSELADDWLVRASAAAERVVRKSVEMRAIALVTRSRP